jgi:hypothetical protein
MGGGSGERGKKQMPLILLTIVISQTGKPKENPKY